jgi:hypothetical protein
MAASKLRAALRSRSWTVPHPHDHNRWSRLSLVLIAPHWLHVLLDGYQAIGRPDLGPIPARFITQLSYELAEPGVRDGAGQSAVPGHSGNIEGLDRDSTLGSREPSGQLVQEMKTAVCGRQVYGRDVAHGLDSIVRSALTADQCLIRPA